MRVQTYSTKYGSRIHRSSDSARLAIVWKYCFVFFACVLLLPGCRPKENELILESVNLPPIYLPSPHVSDKLEVSYDFFYQNDSEEDIVLTLHSTSCGCARVKIVPEKIAPGKSAIISLVYDLSYSHQVRSESVIINTNQKYPKQLVYKLNTVTFPRLEIIRTDYNEIICSPGESKVLTVRCRSYRPKSEDDHGPMILESSSDFLTIHTPRIVMDNEILIGDTVVSEHEYRVQVHSPSPSAPEYDCYGYSTILTLKNRENQVEDKIIWKPHLQIDADTTSVFFNCLIDTIDNELVTLKSNREFSIHSVQTENGMCEVHYDVQRCSNLHLIEISPNLSSISEGSPKNKDVIIFFTDHPLQPQVRIDARFLLPLRK